MFDLNDMEIATLRGPVGLQIGSRTPAEIAIAILAELIQVRAQQLKMGSDFISDMSDARCKA
jgi:xanthine dehydrogenase accessory factor